VSEALPFFKFYQLAIKFYFSPLHVMIHFHFEKSHEQNSPLRPIMTTRVWDLSGHGYICDEKHSTVMGRFIWTVAETNVSIQCISYLALLSVQEHSNTTRRPAAPVITYYI
jgi:hypothetical protein